MDNGALTHLRVIDATSGVAGPITAMFLADFGADVVKVEPPGGDAGRAQPGFAVWNRGKRSVIAEADAKLAELVAGADVVITTAGTVAGLAVDESRAVHVVMPAFLDEVPRRDAHESEGLLASTMGVSLRQASFTGGPIDAVFPILPTVQGIWGAAVTIAALLERQRSQLGQRVTVRGAHGVMVAAAGALTFDPTAAPAARSGNAGGSAPFYRTYQCGDGDWLFLAALTPRFTDLAFKALGLTDLYDDPRLEGRGRAAMLHPDHSPWVSQRLSDVFLSDTRDEWLAQLAAVGCPAGPVLERDAWLDHPQIDAIGMRVEVEDPDRGHVVMPGVPVTLHATPGAVRGPAPAAGSGRAEWVADGWGTPSPAQPRDGGPLDRLRVLDLGAIIAGPFAASLLADLGADVTKVEPLTGDSFRGPGFASYNKGQRGIAIDLQQARGREALLALVREADVVIDNYRPGVLHRLGLEWSALQEVNPTIVTASITGFGDGGPLGSEAGFDPVLQAMSGMMRAQGGDSEPVFFTVPVNDVATAAATAFGALLGVLHRERTAAGQRVTTSLAAMSAFLQAGELVRFDARAPARIGGRDHRGASALARYYEAADGWVRVAADLVADPIAALRGVGLPSVDEDTIAEWVAGRSREEAVALLDQAGVPASAARPARELIEDESIVANDVLRPDARPGREHMWTTGRHAQFSRTTSRADLVAPALGEHTVEILAAAGYSTADIDALIADRVVAVAPSREG